MQLFCGILWNFLDLVPTSALEWLNSIIMWKGLSDERQTGAERSFGRTGKITGDSVEPLKVVARYINGKTVKGLSQDFFPNKDRFHVSPADKASAETVEISLKELKAVFFVRDFAGDAQYNERKKYVDGDKPSGRKIEVTFKDGEVLVGTTLGYDPARPGFFLFPADPKSNNIRVFAVTTAVKNVRYL